MVHRLDMSVHLAGAVVHDLGALGVVRRTLEGLLGRPRPVGWEDATYALNGTGRLPLVDDEHARLGDVPRWPLRG